MQLLAGHAIGDEDDVAFGMVLCLPGNHGVVGLKADTIPYMLAIILKTWFFEYRSRPRRRGTLRERSIQGLCRPHSVHRHGVGGRRGTGDAIEVVPWSVTGSDGARAR